MQIGTIGAGDLAQAFAKRVLKAGHKVKFSNSRGPESLREIVRKLGPEQRLRPGKRQSLAKWCFLL